MQMGLLGIIGVILLSFAIIILAILFVLSFVRPHLYKSCGIDTTTVEGRVEFVRPEKGTPYLIKRKSDGSISDERFKILTCTDMHINTEASAFTFTVFSRFLDKEKPDLVLLLGDNIVGHADTVMQEKLKNFFESRKQYWGFVLGNHDSEYKITKDIKAAEKKGMLSEKDRETIVAAGRKWMFDTLSGGTYCIVRDEGGKGVFGSGNCVVNIKNSKGICQSLFFFDSGDYIYGVRRKAFGSEKRCYGYIRESQIDWYRRRLSELTAENGGIRPKSMAFFHIPLPEFQKAYTAVKRRNGVAKRIYGTNYERVCASDLNAGAFEAFKSSNSTHTVVCGHDHKNDSAIMYKGVRLMYSQGLQYDGAYNRRKKARFLKFLNKINSKFCCFTEGVSLFMVQACGSVDIAAKYAQKEDVFYGLEKYYDRAFITDSEK
ncbi:MAG: metallophosphoesterase [Clostridia bacterium]|nr:metallophosphoesterase [Clostridia bacterium]